MKELAPFFTEIPPESRMQCIRNFELTFRSRQNSVFYFSAETGGKLHRRTDWSEYFSKQAENQFFCSRPRVTGLFKICTRLLYPIKPKTMFKIIWGQIVQFAMRTQTSMQNPQKIRHTQEALLTDNLRRKGTKKIVSFHPSYPPVINFINSSLSAEFGRWLLFNKIKSIFI